MSTATPTSTRVSLSESEFLDVVNGSTTKTIASQDLVRCLRSLPRCTGRLFIGFAIARTSTEQKCIDALWVSPAHGLIAFDLIEGPQLGNFVEHQEDIANQLEIQLRRGESRLVQKKNLVVPIKTVSFSPTGLKCDKDEDYLVLNSELIAEFVEELVPDESFTNERYKLTLSALEHVSYLGKSRIARKVQSPNSLGQRLHRLEASIKTLEYRQSKAVQETVDGVQRIRGLAGSGKTIVLALKAAYLHAQNPDWIIGVTFKTRSLKPFFRRLIREFHLKRIDEEPNWKNLRILNAWGGPGKSERNGIYYEFCRENDISYLDFQTAEIKFGFDDAFKEVCKQALDQTPSIKPVYDAILIDEAQDLPSSFLALCYKFLEEPHRLVYAYDELQNLNRETLPSPETIFGKDEDGRPLVNFGQEDPAHPKPDLILPTCYRNPRPLLVTAHAIGFGIYRNPTENTQSGIVQMFDHPQLWENVGYEVTEGMLVEGQDVTLSRTIDASPAFLEEHSTLEELIVFKPFDTVEQQAEWIAQSIEKNLLEDELNHTDIMVINLNRFTTRESMGPIQAALMDLKIHSHLAGVDTDPDVFELDEIESVTFTGIHRAKGNEAAMVYIINAESGLTTTSNLASVRNRLFTAITRSKAWVRISGIGKDLKELEHEYQRLLSNRFQLRFRYPTAEERKSLRTIYRDLNEHEKRRLNDQNNNLNNLLLALGQGEVKIEHLDPEGVQKLSQLLQKSQT